MSVVYRISCLDESVKECYIGSTLDFHRRMCQHKTCCHNENSNKYNYPLYKFIRENGGWGAWKMTIIDSLTTTDKNEMIKCERKYIDEYNFTLNIVKPTRTKKEYHLDNKEELAEKRKLYRQEHKEEIVEYKRQYAQDHKEELVEKSRQWCNANREKYNERMKHYYQDHKEELAEKMKLYRETNREKISKQKLQKIQCEKCGAFSTRCNLRQHQRTKKCINTTTTTK